MMSAMLEKDLTLLSNNRLLRQMKERTGQLGRHITIGGKHLLNFCSNDYLGLAHDERLANAAVSAMRVYGFGSGASRLVVGNLDLMEKLEITLAQIKQTDECLLFNSGFSANTGIIPALVGREDIIFSDKLNHASIVDGAILSRAEVKRYAHLDLEMLENFLKQSAGFRRRLIVTDAVFSMDGDIAPIKQISALAKQYDAWLLVDEAHSFGVIDCDGDIDIHMGTLSKAAGCFGAYACGKKPLRSYLINHARSFIYTTALPVAVIAAAQQAVDIIASQEGDDRRKKVMAHAYYVREGLKSLGFDILQSQTPIIPVVLKDTDKALKTAAQLLGAGIYVSAIRPPTVPVNTARLRISVTASHTQEDLDMLLNVMRTI